MGFSCLILTLGFIDLGAPFIGSYIIGLCTFRVISTYSSPSLIISGSLLWGNLHILVNLFYMFRDASLCLSNLKLHLGHLNILPTWVLTTYLHHRQVLEVLYGGTLTVSFFSENLLCIIFQGVLAFLFLLSM